MEPMKIPLRILVPTTVMIVGVLGLAACGSDTKTSTKTGGSTQATSSSSAPTADAVVKAADTGTLGTILVDSGGRTVYTLTKDGASVPCTGDCLASWPAVLLPAGVEKAAGGPGVTGLTVVRVTDGKQVAHDGLPVYTFSGDRLAGDTNGDGLASFGGVWHVVKISGAASSSSTDTTDTTARSGYGY
jgi:predicted lipoprotein with Yx(FWY)xxD motif